jgi:WD40 repeat protein
VSGAADRSVKIWDVVTGTRLYTLSEPLDGINAIALSSNGSRVAAGGLDKTIRVWKLGEKEGSIENTLIAHEDAILKLAWSPDGKYLASASADRTIKLFRAADLTEVRTISGQPDWAFGLEFSPDGKSLAAGLFNGVLEIYEVDHDKIMAAK